MNDLQKELQELKAKVADLESRIVAEPVKWQPKGGYWQIDCEGDVVAVDSFSHQKEFGTKRITKEQAYLEAKKGEAKGVEMQLCTKCNTKALILMDGCMTCTITAGIVSVIEEVEL